MGTFQVRVLVLAVVLSAAIGGGVSFAVAWTIANEPRMIQASQLAPDIQSELRGPPGPAGPRGLRGLRGPRGVTGLPGADGLDSTDDVLDLQSRMDDVEYRLEEICGADLVVGDRRYTFNGWTWYLDNFTC